MGQLNTKQQRSKVMFRWEGWRTEDRRQKTEDRRPDGEGRIESCEAGLAGCAVAGCCRPGVPCCRLLAARGPSTDLRRGGCPRFSRAIRRETEAKGRGEKCHLLYDTCLGGGGLQTPKIERRRRRSLASARWRNSCCDRSGPEGARIVHPCSRQGGIRGQYASVLAIYALTRSVPEYAATNVRITNIGLGRR